jgi:hypothetical protein
MLTGLLYLAPLLVLVALLLVRRYPGERQILWLAARRRPRMRPLARRLAPRRRPLTLARVAGGAVIAFELAGRAPPSLR